MLDYDNKGLDLTKLLVKSNLEKNKKRLNQKYGFPAKIKNAWLHYRAIKFGYKA